MMYFGLLFIVEIGLVALCSRIDTTRLIPPRKTPLPRHEAALWALRTGQRTVSLSDEEHVSRTSWTAAHPIPVLIPTEPDEVTCLKIAIPPSIWNG